MVKLIISGLGFYFHTYNFSFVKVQVFFILKYFLKLRFFKSHGFFWNSDFLSSWTTCMSYTTTSVNSVKNMWKSCEIHVKFFTLWKMLWKKICEILDHVKKHVNTLCQFHMLFHRYGLCEKSCENLYPSHIEFHMYVK